MGLVGASRKSPCSVIIIIIIIIISWKQYEIRCELVSSVTSYFQTLSHDILFLVSLVPPSCPPCLEYLRQRALLLLTLVLYKSCTNLLSIIH